MIRHLILTALSLILLALPAEAHRLKLFATVEGDRVTGYAFFIGGGRAMGTDWRVTGANGDLLASGKTDDAGNYSFPAPGVASAPVTITVDTHEGHIATLSLPAERFGGLAAPVQATSGAPAAASAPTDDARLALLVEAAVARQITPLQEQIEALQDRMRFTDILSALFLIAGVAGVGLWARGRRK